MKRKENPRHYWIQVVYADESIESKKLFCTSAFVQFKAENIARSNDKVIRVLILDGKADPDNPHPDLVVNVVEKLKEEAGKDFSEVIDRFTFNRRIKTEEGDSTNIRILKTLPPVYTTLGRWNAHKKPKRKTRKLSF